METINHRFNIALKQHQVVWTFADTNSTYSLSDIEQLVEDCAQKLHDHGLRAQDSVGLVLNNGIEMVTCLLACWRLNLIAIPLRTKAGKYLNYADFLQGCNNSCQFKLVLCDRSIADADIAQWRAHTGLDIHAQASFSPERGADRPEVAQPGQEDLAIIQFSSGSTGFPKGVMVTHRMIINQLQHIVDSHRANTGGSIHHTACWTPMHHDMGLFTGVLLPIFGANDHTVATPDYFMRNPARWFRLLAQNQVDLSFITNSAMVAALRTVKRLHSGDPVDLSRLQLYLSAEKISPVVLRKIREQFAPFQLLPEHIHSAYGMAENSLGASCTGLGELKILAVTISPEGRVERVAEGGDHVIELVSSGVANTHHRISIRDASDRPLGELELGEINLESDCLTPGYLNMPEATRAKLVDGRLRTGDLGFMYNNELYFYSRQDDLIVVGGRNVVPDDVEETVESLEFIRPSGSALVSIENENSGLMELHLVLEGDANCSQAELMVMQEKLVQTVLDHHDIVLSRLYFCARGTIEKTSSGKKRRSVIRRRLINKQLDILVKQA